MRPALNAAASVLAIAVASGAAAAPAVVADIAPVHSIVARVMEGVAAPALLVPPGVSEHGYALRPSEAAVLAEADALVWVGAGLTPWLAEAAEALAPKARRVTLADAPGARTLPVREGATFEAHDHAGQGHDHAHDHDHDHAEHAEGEDEHADHDNDAGHADDHAHHDGHDHDHDHEEAHAGTDDHDAHEHGGVDPHLWLDPANAAVFAAAIARELGALDPDNAGAYDANAAVFADEIEALRAAVSATLAPVSGRPFVVFHDAYQYFEVAFGMPAAGAISLSDATAPSAGRVAEVRERVRDLGAACVFVEPQFNPALAATVVEGTAARVGELDPLGAGLTPGVGLYVDLIRGMASSLAGCLADPS